MGLRPFRNKCPIERRYTTQVPSHLEAHRQKFSRKGRAALIFVGVLVLVVSVGSLWSRGLHYPNYWGGAVFAPFGIVVAALAFFAAFCGFVKVRPEKTRRRR